MFSIVSTVPYSKWNDHVLSWWKHREDPNVLFLKYEDMLKVYNCFAQILTVLDRVSPTRTLLLGQRIIRRKMMAKLIGIMTSIINSREFKIYDATEAKTSLKIASSSFSIYFAIMSVCLTFES